MVSIFWDEKSVDEVDGSELTSEAWRWSEVAGLMGIRTPWVRGN
jgi:hypothetical protein